MGAEIKIICDTCDKDITTCEGGLDYRLYLLAQKVPNRSNIQLDLCVRPPIDDDMYFCSLRCLEKSDILKSNETHGGKQ